MPAFFHCVDIDGVNIALQVDTSDPVTPISQADFVTGDITNPLVGNQNVFLFKYTGTASNGSTDGTMIAVDDEVISFKALMLMNADTVKLDDIPESAALASTTDATPTVIGALPVREDVSLLVTVAIHAARTDASEETAYWVRRYTFIRITTGALAVESSKLIDKNNPGGMNAVLVVSGNYIHAQVTGSAAETWKWAIAELKIDTMELS